MSFSKMIVYLLALLFCTGEAFAGVAYEMLYDNSEGCANPAKPADHLMIEFDLIAPNGTSYVSVKLPSQLRHVVLGEQDATSLHGVLNGMCQNETRKVYFSTSYEINLSPILPVISGYSGDHSPLTVEITLHHITSETDFQIFPALREGNISLAFDLLDQHIGVNAVDEYGQTPLMIAIINKHVHIIAELMNTRRPTVDINFAKHSGFTALFYAVQHSQGSILQGLLRRGADPTMTTADHNNTPLHIACLLEKRKAAELLLEYGADPLAVNSFGQTPLQVMPSNALQSNRIYFKKLFEESVKTRSNRLSARGDL